MISTYDVIKLARNHVGNNKANEESARLCLLDAVELYDRDDYKGARARAIKSLAYSIGRFHKDYNRAISD